MDEIRERPGYGNSPGNQGKGPAMKPGRPKPKPSEGGFTPRLTLHTTLFPTWANYLASKVSSLAKGELARKNY